MTTPEDPSRARLSSLPQLRHWIVLPLAIVVATLAVGFSVKLDPAVASTELGLDQALSRDHVGVLTSIALAIETVISPPGIVAIMVALFLFLLIVRRAPVNAVAVGSVATIGWLSSEAYKLVVAEPRPDSRLLADPLLPQDSTFSFPSGHTTFAMSLAIALYFLARNTRWAGATLIGGAVFVVIVGASRLYLGVHYLTDVLASIAVAATTIALFAGVWNRVGLAVLNRVPIIGRFGPIPPAPSRPRRGRARRAVAEPMAG